MNDSLRVRLDKWLWAARFFKTRAWPPRRPRAGCIQINGQAAKASREVRIGDRSNCARGGGSARCWCAELSPVRGPAPVAQALYAETAESLAAAPRPRSSAAGRRARAGASNRAAPPSATAASWPTGSAGAPASMTARPGFALKWPAVKKAPGQPLKPAQPPPV
jgi:ribosomal 50S subunit-recycling heat shock protein